MRFLRKQLSQKTELSPLLLKHSLPEPTPMQLPWMLRRTQEAPAFPPSLHAWTTLCYFPLPECPLRKAASGGARRLAQHLCNLCPGPAATSTSRGNRVKQEEETLTADYHFVFLNEVAFLFIWLQNKQHCSLFFSS